MKKTKKKTSLSENQEKTLEYLKSKIKRLKAKKKIPVNVKCDCRHTKKDHFEKSGQCNECGCTWFHPSIFYIKTKNKELGRITKMP